jgi:hypothetical protein
LVSPQPPQRSGESTRSNVLAEKQPAGTRGADPRGQAETRISARPAGGAEQHTVMLGAVCRAGHVS